MPEILLDVDGNYKLQVSIDGKNYHFDLSDENPNIHEAKFCAQAFANRIYFEVMKHFGYENQVPMAELLGFE